ncbi:K(+)/H(+) antiporter YhaU [Fuerstiella marisgermanici]|uniref:K(+)/H(+) antiporter YhaU n=2 Tax=Fuerstiella marisgermanici TaxID=1891926 RepID=A0A1P8WGJ2_9PLAN|nr:K(+)/H(+) antiporter YhaU [Fuerstiella marisgermanici]
MARLNNNRKSQRRTISWKAVFVVFMMTLFAWGQQFVALPSGASQVVADEISEPSESQATTEPADSGAPAASHDAETSTDAGHHNGGSHGDSEHSGGHTDPVAEVLLAILIILFLAKISGDLFERAGMPAVLGELTVGIVLGNWALFTGSHALDFFKPVPTPYVISGEVIDTWKNPQHPTQDELWSAFETVTEESERKVGERIEVQASDVAGPVGMVWQWYREQDGTDVWHLQNPHATPEHLNLTGTMLDMLARIGVVLLLFEVGLESRVKEMVRVGVSSLLVALLGVLAPMLLGFGVGYLLVSETSADWQVPAFLGATLCATSVGITARVLKDLGCSQDKESKIILGAAVIDDVLGLVVLAVVSGVIMEGANFHVMALVKIVGLSVAFLAGALILGALQFPRMLFRAASFLRGHGLLVTTALTICFLFSWGANKAGLATIIGAFAAGLILEGAHYQEAGEKWKNRRLEDALAPLSALLVPIFFVATGIAVDLSQFSGGAVWVLAIALTIVAIIGKLVCAFGVREAGLNRLAVGFGMIPRGEVGLIFAQVGQGLQTPDGKSVVDNGTYSAIVVMVMVTTMITPPLLKWAMSKNGKSTESVAKA